LAIGSHKVFQCVDIRCESQLVDLVKCALLDVFNAALRAIEGQGWPWSDWTADSPGSK
jgi:hypothetical protein